MKPDEVKRRRTASRKGWLVVPMLLVSAVAAAQPSAGLPPQYAIQNGTVAGGGGLQKHDCYTLVSTIGEAFVGRISADIYTLTSGFPATIDLEDDSLFRDGFESQSGVCAP